MHVSLKNWEWPGDKAIIVFGNVNSLEWNDGLEWWSGLLGTGLLEGCGRRLWRMRIAGAQLAIRPRVFGVREVQMV